MKQCEALITKSNKVRFIYFYSALSCSMLMIAPGARAAIVDRTWVGGTGDWNTAGNWNPADVPDTATERALFNTGTGTVSINQSTTAHSANFAIGSDAYILSIEGGTLTLVGDGTDAGLLIGNGSGIRQTLNATGSGGLKLKTGTIENLTISLTANDAGGSFSIDSNQKLTLTGNSVINNNANGNQIPKFIYLNDGSTISGGAINNGSQVLTNGDATLEDVAVTNERGNLQVSSNNTLALAGSSTVTNSVDTDSNLGNTTLSSGSTISGGSLNNTGGYTSTNGDTTLTNVAVISTADGNNFPGFLQVGNNHTLTLDGTSSITNNANAGGDRGYTRLNNGSTISGGTLNNTGGYTDILGDATLTNVALTNTADANGTGGYLDVSANQTLTLTGTSAITNNANANGVLGHTELGDGSTISGGTLNNTGGYTNVGGNATLANVTVTNTADGNDRTGYVVVATDQTLTLAGTSTITNTSEGGSRAFTQLLDGSTISGGTLNNIGGITYVEGNATLTNVTVTNSIDANNRLGNTLIYPNKTLTLTGTSTITNNATGSFFGFVQLYDGSAITGGALGNTGGYTRISGNATLTNVTVTNTADGNDKQGYLGIDSNKTLTLTGTSAITNNANAGGVQGYTRLQDGSAISGGSLNNTGGYTDIQGDATLTNVTVTNTADANDIEGYLEVDTNDTLTLTGTSSITNTANGNGAGGYTDLKDGSTISGGTLNNTGGYTTTSGDATLTNVTVTNTADANDTEGYLKIGANDTLTLTGTSSVTNNANTGDSRGSLQLDSGSTFSGDTITNFGGYTSFSGAGASTTATVKNLINASGVAGYTYFNTDNSTTNMVFGVNTTTAGFAIVANGSTLTLPNGTLVLHLDVSGGTAAYTNTKRTLVYGVGTGALTTPTNIELKKLSDGSALSTLTATIDDDAGANTTDDAIGATEKTGGGTTLIPLLRLNLALESLSNGAQQAIDKTRALAGQARNLVNKTTNTAHSILRSFSKQALSQGAQRGGYGKTNNGPQNFSAHKFGFRQDDEAFLPTTDRMMGISAEQNARTMAAFRPNDTGLWVQPFGQVVDEGSSSTGIGYQARTTGALFGMDHRLKPNLLVGGAVGYALSTSDARDNSRTMVKDRFLSLFTLYEHGKAFFEAFLTGGLNRIRLGRAVDATTKASNTHNSYHVAPSIGAGYNYDLAKDWTAQFYGNTTFVYSKEQGYTEDGAGADNQTIKSTQNSMLRTELGTDFIHKVDHNFGRGLYTVGAYVALEDPIKKGNVKGTVGGDSLVGSNNAATTVRAGLHASSAFSLENNWNLALNYSGEFGTKYHAHEASVTFKKRLG